MLQLRSLVNLLHSKTGENTKLHFNAQLQFLLRRFHPFVSILTLSRPHVVNLSRFIRINDFLLL